eukprot:s1353_g1.t1
MCSVVSPEGGVEEFIEFPSALLVSWGIIGALCFFLGVVCTACCQRSSKAPPSTFTRWEKLAKKAIHFVNRRRRVALAFGAYKDTTLRNSEGALPSGIAMDPTDDELGQIVQYQDALDWAGVDGDLAAALQND